MLLIIILLSLITLVSIAAFLLKPKKLSIYQLNKELIEQASYKIVVQNGETIYTYEKSEEYQSIINERCFKNSLYNTTHQYVGTIENAIESRLRNLFYQRINDYYVVMNGETKYPKKS